MRAMQVTGQYKRDLKRSKSGGNHPADELRKILEMLAMDQPLPAKNKDHALTGDWIGFRDCHVLPDLLLIYDKPDAETLKLRRLGSHAEIFG